jgi:YfaZ precursor
MNPRLMKWLAAILILATHAATAQQRDSGRAASGELALSNDTLQLRYLGSGQVVGVGGAQFTGSALLAEQRDFVLDAGLLYPMEFGINRLQVKIGPQVYAALLQEENDDVMAITLGTEVRFFIDPSRGLAVSGQAFYSPDILTFGSADNLTDLSARVEVNVAEKVQAFVGMRWFEFDLTEGRGKRTLQDEAFVGVGYRF